MTKKILGLDLGTNSIGWALVENNFDKKEGKIIDNGVRIIPMGDFASTITGSISKDPIREFSMGVGLSKTKKRTDYRGARKLYQRDNLRRERLHRVLNVLQFLPDHYANAIDFKKYLGQFKEGQEVKLNYIPNSKGKDKFIFLKSFLEMVAEFKKEQPQLFHTRKNGIEAKISYDWTIYYLRKKALTQKIEKEELAWLLLNFNQKRGYHQLRGEDEDFDKEKNKTFEKLEILKVVDTGNILRKTGEKLYDIFFTNGWQYDKQTTKPENWLDKTKEFIVTVTTLKDGSIKRSYKSVNSEEDWIAIKKKTEQDIKQSNKTVGSFIYDSLLKNPSQKINGKLIKTIERKFYKEELEKILIRQIEFHSELKDKNTYIKCVEELYPKNEAHKNNIISKKKNEMFRYLFIDDIIFYQRPLKSKKSNIASCPYESRIFFKGDEKVKQGLKVISKSHPYFIEFRLWQFIHNLRIYKVEKEKDTDLTSQFLKTEDDITDLYDFLNDKNEVEQKNIIKYFIDLKKIDKKEKDIYRWNYVMDKKYPINPTRNSILNRLKKVENINGSNFLTLEKELHLWHIIYSVTDKKEFEKSLESYADKFELDKGTFVEAFKKHPPYSSDYGAYSEKAIKKLLPLMRRGKYWDENAIPEKVKAFVFEIYERIKHLKDGEKKEQGLKNAVNLISDDAISKQFIKSFLRHTLNNPLMGLNTYQACYAVYKRHSEASLITQWKSPKDIDNYLGSFKQYSLRNPIIEQVVLETLRTVRDIWEYNLSIDDKFKFSEIHLELGRDIKNSADKRKRISQKQTQNENTNKRIKLLLEEMYEEGARSYSPGHQEILKIYEEGITQSPQTSYEKVKEEEIEKIKKNAKPSSNDIKKYKLWLEQGYISPYTGKTISISRLFTHEYQIEHIIPQSRYFDDSLGNKIICEATINEDKSNKTAYEYLKAKGGSIVHGIRLLTIEEYENHCSKYFKNNRTKLKNLLSEEIPEGFINRQLNDSRYIAKFIKGILSNIVREENENEITSKNLIAVSGAIIAKLKQDWGMNEQWNKIIQPRFERLNGISNSEKYGYLDYKKDGNKNNTGKQFFRIIVPEGVNKKRIDHRHHSLDAIVIATCTRDHINYITSLETERKNHKLVSKLCNLKKINRKRNDKIETIEVFDSYKKPWKNFTIDVLNTLEKTTVSFKKNTRIITKTNNKTWQWVKDEKGNLKKQLVSQIKGDSRAIRRPLHKETFYGLVNIKQKKKGSSSLRNFIEYPELVIDKEIRGKIKALNKLFDSDKKKILKYLKDNPIKQNGEVVDKIKVWEWTKNATASRVKLSDSFTRKQLESITDSGIQKILEKHVKGYIKENGEEQFNLAFNPEGIEKLNENIIVLNNGKNHQPIYAVRVYEEGSRFSVSSNENNLNKTKKYVEAAKGTNLFFAVYWSVSKEQRVYESIPLKEVIDWQKWRAKNKVFDEPLIPINKEKGEFLFFLSPNDLVFVPTKEEQDTPSLVDFSNLSKEQVDRVYKMVSTTKGECHFVSQYYSTNIISNENGSNNKNERVQLKDLNELDEKGKPKMIKSICWKLKVNRLGKIEKVER